MARRAEGWRTYRDPRTKVHFVRFTHGGRRYTLATGERNPRTAAGTAARLYADVVSGRWAPARSPPPAPTGARFEDLAAEWLGEVEPTIEPRTFKLYADVYVGSHFAPFFVTVDRLTTVRAEEFIAARLRQVSRETLKKELSVLRRFARWARRRGHLVDMPEIETPGHRVVGTLCDKSRKRQFQIFTADEIERLVSHLPEWTKAPRAPKPYSVRARYVVAWETALRPQTLARLRAPDDYRRGAQTLTVRDEVDKSRFGRELPLSEEARAALNRVCPGAGIIFGHHDCRMLLRRAAKAAEIDEHRASRITDYDFRHSRLTYLGQVTDNLSGVMYLAGHKQPATTARYLRPQKEAAEDVLAAAAAAKRGAHG